MAKNLKYTKSTRNINFISLYQVFTLFLALVQELQHQHSHSSANQPNDKSNLDEIQRSEVTNSSLNTVNIETTKPPTPLKDPKCSDLEAYTIYPNDSSREVRKKQGIKIL